ncbi:MAG: DNA recombination protein RmuC [Acidimicrobiales bacterium]
MSIVLGGVVGVVLGLAVAWTLSTKKTQSVRDELAKSTQDLAVRDTQLHAANEMLERERLERAAALEGLEVTFENTSNRVLSRTVQEFNQSQEQVLKERDSKLTHTLKPLEDLLDEYKRNLADFNKEHVGALSDVKSKAVELLEAQQKTQAETRRLNQLLGRGDQRGKWGEIQLANVMDASGLRRNIDYDLQVSGVNDSGRSLRPDCIVKMPNGASIAVDAKFPFDDFERAIASEDLDERRRNFDEFAKKLRGHVKTLREKSYWEIITPAPEFTVCFVPSDAAITAAFDADPTLHAFAATERVLIVGPTNLLSLLWSVAFVVRQHEAQVNAKEILDMAEKIVDRIRLVAEPITKLGRSLNDTVNNYNQMVKSVESRLIVSAREIRRLGGAQRAKAVPDLKSIHEAPVALNDAKWGIGPATPLLEGASEIIDLDEFDDLDEE